MIKDILNAYYENTVIPAIICGSVTSLVLSAGRFINGAYFYLTPWEAVFCVLLFLGIMTVVDAISWFRECVSALDALEGSTTDWE